MKLFLLRHGKAEENEGQKSDFERDLNKKGNKQINKIGQFLQNYSQEIDHILTSSAKRTMSTMQIMKDYIGVNSIQADKNLYLASVPTISLSISKQLNKGDLLYVGHNFGISQLVEYYTGHSVVLSTGSLAIIDFECESFQEIIQDSGILIEVINPKTLD